MKGQNIEHYSGEELHILAETYNYQEWIAEQFHPYLRGKIMEIGAGTGTMAKRWLVYADELHLVEPARNLFPVLQKVFHSNLKVFLHHGALEEILSVKPELAVGAFDVIVMVNVLEHMEDDVRVLDLVNQMLKPSGHLLIFVPAMPGLYGPLDQKFGHYRRYTREGLASICRKSGHEITSVRYFDVFGIFPWWFVNRILRSSNMSLRMARIYDRFVVPLTRHAEKAVSFPFGKNLVLVGHKVGP